MSRGATKYWCNDCNVKFTVYRKKFMKTPYCPLCGDRIAVKEQPKHVKTPELRGVNKPRWLPEQTKELIRIYNTTNYTFSEIGQILGKTESSVNKKIQRLREEKKII